MSNLAVSNNKDSIAMDNQMPPPNHKRPLQTFTCKVKPLSFEEKEELRMRILHEMTFRLRIEN